MSTKLESTTRSSENRGGIPIDIRNMEPIVDTSHVKIFDLNEILTGINSKWRKQGFTIARKNGFRKPFWNIPKDMLKENPMGIHCGRVEGEDVAENLPWVGQVLNVSAKLASKYFQDPTIVAALNPEYAAILNMQSGTRERFIDHTDSNPYAGLLGFTDQEEGTGGVLVIDGKEYYPKAGQLILFNGRLPHRVTPLVDEDGFRLVLVMNLYNDEVPESSRDEKLTQARREHPIKGQYLPPEKWDKIMEKQGFDLAA